MARGARGMWTAGVTAVVLLLAGCPDKVAAKAFNSCQWGKKHFQELDHAAAQREFDNALEAKPNYTGARIGRALVHDSYSRYEEAIAELNLAAQRSPKSPQVLQTRACMHEHAGNATQAQEDEDAAKALAPDMKPEHRCDKRWMFDLKFDFCQVKGE